MANYETNPEFEKMAQELFDDEILEDGPFFEPEGFRGCTLVAKRYALATFSIVVIVAIMNFVFLAWMIGFEGASFAAVSTQGKTIHLETD